MMLYVDVSEHLFRPFWESTVSFKDTDHLAVMS